MTHRQAQTLAGLIEKVKEAGLKVTKPRTAILEVLITEHGPFTAEELHKKISRRVCDLATVYRSLTSMEEAKIVKRCEFGDGFARYELTEKDEHHHHHVICVTCKKVEPLEDCHLGEIDRFAQKKGFANVSHSLEFFGVCESCQ